MSEPLSPLRFPLWGSRLIEASAGTGKTWTIAALYLRLVLGHGDADTAFGRPLLPSQILVMTFTVAATRELSDRIRARLVAAARCFRGEQPVAPDDELMRGLMAEYADGPAREVAAWRLAMAAEAMDDAAIHTIDAWVQRMLREHAFDSGSLFDEELQPDEESMLAEAARDYWRQEVYPLTGAALDGVLSVWTDVVALTNDVRKLLRNIGADDADARSLAAVQTEADGDRRAASMKLKDGWVARSREMRAWLTAQLAAKERPFDGKKLQAGRTSGWLDILDAWAATPELIELALTPAARRRLSPDGLREACAPGRVLQVPPQFEALGKVLEALDHLVEPAHAMRRHAAAHVAGRVRQLKHRANVYGFADMLERLDAALAGKSGGRLRDRILEQYPVSLIDEFQDTSPLQYRIFDRLYRTEDNDRATALLLIGDPKQSIYAFRGADIHSYLRARIATTGRHYLLTTNYRSNVATVAAINRLFEEAEARGGQGAFRFRNSNANADADLDKNPLPFVPVAAHGRSEVFRSAAGTMPALTLCHDAELSSKADVQRRFAERCAEHIATHLNDPAAGFDDSGRGFTRLRPADIAVLVVDRHEAAAVRRALQERRIASVYLSDQDSVFASPEARDLLHWLRAVADPLDSRRARVAFATRLIGLSLERMAVLSQDDLAFEHRVEQLRQLNGIWHRQGVLPMLRKTLHLLDLPARWLAHPEGERSLTNVLHLAELLQAASERLDGEQAVIRWLAEQLEIVGTAVDENIVRLESDADLVKVVTIYKAKGLEYPVVYLPFACSFRDPKQNADDVAIVVDDDGQRSLEFRVSDDARRSIALERQQEELRVLYVALTRARHALWLGVPASQGGLSKACAFHRSAFGYLLTGGNAVHESEIAGLLERTFGHLPSVVLTSVAGRSAHTRLSVRDEVVPLHVADAYVGSIERDWAIGSFSSLVHDLPRVLAVQVTAQAIVSPAMEEELLSGPVEADVPVASKAPRHRFPRGALPGNFLHDQLEWLAEQRFALATDGALAQQLARRCERQGWGHRADDVVTWMQEVVTTPLPPLGAALDAVPRIVPEMEFWFPSDGIDANRIDDLCRRYLLGQRARPPLPDRSLRGMLMGFADLVLEVDGRYWVLDYKSNALGTHDADYHRDALEAAMAEHRYDVQAAIYLLALHRLLKQRLGSRYEPARQLGGAIYLFLRGIKGPESGCYVVEPMLELLDALDRALTADEGVAS